MTVTHGMIRLGLGLVTAAAFGTIAGCAKHADFVELRDHLATVAKSQDQDQRRLDALQRRMDSLERVKDAEPSKAKLDDLSARMQKLEAGCPNSMTRWSHPRCPSSTRWRQIPRNRRSRKNREGLSP